MRVVWSAHKSITPRLFSCRWGDVNLLRLEVADHAQGLALANWRGGHDVEYHAGKWRADLLYCIAEEVGQNAEQSSLGHGLVRLDARVEDARDRAAQHFAAVDPDGMLDAPRFAGQHLEMAKQIEDADLSQRRSRC